MELNVHLILVGTTTNDPIYSGILIYGNVDRIYLLHSEEAIGAAKEVKRKLSHFRIEVILKKINIFSVDNMVNTISGIAKNEVDNNLFINITSGTNLMAGAACATSYFIGAQAYYIKDQRKLPPNSPKRDTLIELPVPNIRYNEALDKTQIEILQMIAKHDGPSSARFLRQNGLNISAQNLSYHLKELVRKRLILMIPSTIDSRIKDLHLTDVGKLILSWSE
jgi:hypothetical protein